MQWRVLLAIALVTGACSAQAGDPAAAPDLHGSRIEVLAVWQDVEAERFGRVLERFERLTGADVVYTSTEGNDVNAVIDARLAAGDPPDIAILPQPGLLKRYARQGVLAPLDDIVGEVVRDSWSAEWQRLASVDGHVYGVWFKAAHKSLVWYDIAAFERAGVVPPSNPDAFTAVAQALVASGTPAFAVAARDEWTLTDWFENIYLRAAGQERYDSLAEHRIPWTDPSVVEALSLLARLVAAPVAAGGPATTFEQSISMVFAQHPPAAAMVMEGDFVGGFITATTPARLGVHADVFPFPDAEPSRRLVVGGGDAVVLLRDSAPARALVRDLARPAAAEVWARLGGFVSANENVDLAVYPDDISRGIARSLIEAGDGFRFDLSDLQPASFGSTTGQGMFGILGQFAADPSDPAATAARLEAAYNEFSEG